MDLFNDINEKGATVILSTHDVDTAYSWADHILVMKEGMLIKEGTPEEIFRDDELLENTDLVKPLVLEVYEELIKAGQVCWDMLMPKNKKELFKIIQKSIMLMQKI